MTGNSNIPYCLLISSGLLNTNLFGFPELIGRDNQEIDAFAYMRNSKLFGVVDRSVPNRSLFDYLSCCRHQFQG